MFVAYLMFSIFLIHESVSVLNIFWLLIISSGVKFVTTKNHFLMILLSLEMLALAAVFLLSVYLTSMSLSSVLIFSFMVMMVGEACLGLGLLVFLGRLKSGELEVSKTLI